MKSIKSYARCEYCDKLIEVVSPPTKEQYEQGLIKIEGRSSVLIPDDVVIASHKDGVSDSHATFLDGFYCNVDCLSNHIWNIVHRQSEVMLFEEKK